jgi:hypothetical protein
MRVLVCVAAVAAAIALACDDGGGDHAAGPAASAEQDTQGAPPPRATAFADYPAAVAAYLTQHPNSGSGRACLAELYQAWSMPYYSGERSCRAGNTDRDAADEVIAVLAEPAAGDCIGSPLSYRVVVFDTRDAGFAPVYESGETVLSCTAANMLGNVILTVQDVNGDGGGELAYGLVQCGAHTCTTSVHVVSGAAAGYRPLTPPDGLSIQTPTRIEFTDTDEDGAIEIILAGGSIQSAAGPQRSRTEVYAAEGGVYALRSRGYSAPVLRYHKVIDSDRLFAEDRYAEAERSYIVAATATSWRDAGEWWGPPEKNESNELAVYSLFRAALAAILAGRGDDAAFAHLVTARSLDAPLHAEIIAAFDDTYRDTGDLSIACAAVDDAVQRRLEELNAFWYYGYANPPFAAASVCPF